MTLASTIQTAQTIFGNTATQSAIVAKNIQNSGNADYARRLAMMGIDADGQRFVTIQRAQNSNLFKQNVTSISEEAGQERLLSGLQQLQSMLGGDGYKNSPSHYMSVLRDSLQAYAASPNNNTMASTAASNARDLANSLNTTTLSVQEMRAQVDKEISEQVLQLNQMLKKFGEANDQIITFTATGKDASDALDRRDALLKQIASITGIQAVTRNNNDMVLYNTDGTVLFENSARAVTFVPKGTFDASTTGNEVFVDGIAMKAGTGGNTTGQGTLAILLQLRDDVAPTMQAQLDEIARGLINIFRETDQTATAQPDLAGLFTWDGGPTLPSATTLVPGIAGTIKVADAVIAKPTLLRDGGINGGDYSPNDPTGTSPISVGYSKVLDDYLVDMSTDRSFDVSAGIVGKATIISYGAASIGWLEEVRSAAKNASETKSAMRSQTDQALANATGVSLDEELSLMLDLEQSYKASAKLLSTVSEMLRTLLDSVR
ncbi:flagellar hook-associated protein 1 FlgK [Rhizobium sp. RU20A]|uniref:flagellar hook-associated protein FlgK n=1 Tax=Rhizobium sp. RU20A TaxID=1907412 RepID=UPI000955F70D|nr:flagellar hook-associated protein FlgK [Rhizobium sp. RU20A]SIQ55446.1 flagellar hook-associated protein 1 FlgK [Rhizobium sp. RU20A]